MALEALSVFLNQKAIKMDIFEAWNRYFIGQCGWRSSGRVPLNP